MSVSTWDMYDTYQAEKEAGGGMIGYFFIVITLYGVLPYSFWSEHTK